MEILLEVLVGVTYRSKAVPDKVSCLLRHLRRSRQAVLQVPVDLCKHSDAFARGKMRHVKVYGRDGEFF